MFKKTKNIALMAGVLAAVSFGGSALASAGAATTASPVKTKAAVTKTSGKMTEKAKADAETADGNGSADAETNDGAETGSEVSENDGPGGHADEPGNPNAEHQASGQE